MLSLRIMLQYTPMFFNSKSVFLCSLDFYLLQTQKYLIHLVLFILNRILVAKDDSQFPTNQQIKLQRKINNFPHGVRNN
jgi:hypothetical protein